MIIIDILAGIVTAIAVGCLLVVIGAEIVAITLFFKSCAQELLNRWWVK